MSPENQAPQTEAPLLLDKVQTVANTNLTRRKAVKLGIYAAYTAPVLLALLTPSKKAHADLGSPPNEP
jgi:hypothetical protein